MDRPIGLFDSGFGGLTIMREVARLLPCEHLLYLGDTANLPYGNKSPEKVTQLSLENGIFLAEKNIKLLIISCHTACLYALESLQKILPIPVLGVIQPGLELVKNFQRVAILGTLNTVESGIYQALIRKQNPQATIYAKACPLFVSLIEEGFHTHPASILIARSYLESLKGQIDAALLACTHYPLIRSTLQKTLGLKTILIDPAQRCAELVKEALLEKGLLNSQTEEPRYQFYTTDDPEKFSHLGKTFFGCDLKNVEKK